MNRIFEKSSGGIVYRKQENGQIDVLLLERKNLKGETDYVLPKGHMEK